MRLKMSYYLKLFFNFVLLFSFSTLLTFKGFRSYIHTLGESFIRLFTTHFSSQNYSDKNKNDIKLTNISIKILLYGIVPLATVLIFLLMYFNGNNAVKRDPIKAKEWFEKAAAQNFASAQHELGVMYAKGEGIKQDKKVAKEWFRKACDNKVQKSCRIYKRLNEQGY
jgi:TPR repeat protein